jgi:hypothetical protein
MSDCDYFSTFRANSGLIQKDALPFDPSEAGLSGTINKIESFSSLDELEAFLNQCIQVHDTFVLIRALALQYIYEQNVYLYAGNSSTYDFCEKQPKTSPFHLSKSTVNSDIKTAKILKTLTSEDWNYNTRHYLEKNSKETKRGINGGHEFKLSDFAGHKEKLGLLGRIPREKLPKVFNWEIFFESTVGEFKDYVNNTLEKNNHIENTINYFDGTLESLDPFSKFFKDAESKPVRFYEKIKINTDKLPSGVIMDKDIFKLFSNLNKKNSSLIKKFLAER